MEGMDKLYVTAFDDAGDYKGWYCSTCDYFWNRSEVEGGE